MPLTGGLRPETEVLQPTAGGGGGLVVQFEGLTAFIASMCFRCMFVLAKLFETWGRKYRALVPPGCPDALSLHVRGKTVLCWDVIYCY